MISPSADKATIRAVIASDEYLLSLGFEPDYIMCTNSTDDSLSEQPPKKQIFIYNAPSRSGNNDTDLEMVMQIEVFVPLYQTDIGDNAIEQIMALLQGLQMKNHSPLKICAPSPVPLACPSSFYCIAARFSYYATTINEVKKVT